MRDRLYSKLQNSYLEPHFQTEVFRPLDVDSLLDLEYSQLSGGELQRVEICICLGKVADIYLIDEPSAYLDSEQRIICAKVIKRFILNNKKSAFVVEHDFIMATYLANQVILFDGIASKSAIAKQPESLLSGMNKFLKQLSLSLLKVIPNCLRNLFIPLNNDSGE